MKTLFKSIILSTLLLTSAHAGEYGTNYKKLCANTKTEAKAKRSTMDHVEALKQIGVPIVVEQADGCAKIKALLKDPNTYIVDARAKAIRKKLKLSVPTIKVVGDYQDPKGHQFQPGLFEKLVMKQLERKGRKIASEEDLKKFNFIVFCNHIKCYRNTQAACSLKEMGYDSNRIYMAVDGYEPLRKCL